MLLHCAGHNSQANTLMVMCQCTETGGHPENTVVSTPKQCKGGGALANAHLSGYGNLSQMTVLPQTSQLSIGLFVLIVIDARLKVLCTVA